MSNCDGNNPNELFDPVVELERILAEKDSEIERLKNWDVRCMDCSRPYPHGLDMILTLKQWTMIHPDRGGVLCPSCIVNRAAQIEGTIAVYAHIVRSSDDKSEDPLASIIEAMRMENADYCSANGDLKHKKELLEAERDELRATNEQLAESRDNHWKEIERLRDANQELRASRSVPQEGRNTKGIENA